MSVTTENQPAVEQLSEDELELAARLYIIMDDPEEVLADARRQGLLDGVIGNV